MWGKKQKEIVVVKESIEADRVYDLLCDALPSQYSIEVFYLANRDKPYSWERYGQQNRSLYVKIKGPDIELKVRGQSFKEILRKISPTLAAHCEEGFQELLAIEMNRSSDC